ncbi:UPF0149 family protein [Roseateles sp. So40a]|uniref:UPF0149 family protein n=1 Tax=Roseateles sp. So40a TaxID=3400226 RepID=UPI003A88E824
MTDTPMDDDFGAAIDVENAQRLGELLAVLAGQADPDAPAITLDTLDGYLTALRVGPTDAAPIQAMDALFGDDWPASLDEQDMTDAFMEALHVRWNEIGDSLDPQPLLESPEQMHLMPLISEFDEETKAELVAQGAITAELLERMPAPGAMWAQGFLQAVDDTHAWELPAGDGADDLKLMIAAIDAVTLAEDATPRAEYIAQAYEEPEGIDQNALIDDMLFTVQDLRLFWMQQRTLKDAIAGLTSANDSTH